MPAAVPVVDPPPAHPVSKMPLDTVQVVGAGGKPLPAPYKSVGNEALDTLAFLHLLEQLKVQKRSGWIREGVREPESISDHMCRMALMAMMVPTDSSRPLDIPRCVMMALVHDLAEAHVGDITPVEGVSPQVKHQLEEEAMDSFLSEMLGGEGMRDARERFRSLWNEYEARETPESKLVKVGLKDFGAHTAHVRRISTASSSLCKRWNTSGRKASILCIPSSSGRYLIWNIRRSERGQRHSWRNAGSCGSPKARARKNALDWKDVPSALPWIANDPMGSETMCRLPLFTSPGDE